MSPSLALSSIDRVGSEMLLGLTYFRSSNRASAAILRQPRHRLAARELAAQRLGLAIALRHAGLVHGLAGIGSVSLLQLQLDRVLSRVHRCRGHHAVDVALADGDLCGESAAGSLLAMPPAP